MNKQQLIDKAIDDLGGQWPALDFRKPYTVLYYLNCRKDAELATKVTDDGVEVTTKICTRQEFEARKAEREAASNRMADIMFGNSLPGFSKKVTEDVGSILVTISAGGGCGHAHKQTAHWFDYENQKALRLPPVGEVCLVVSDIAKGEFTFEPCEVVKHIGKNAAFVTPEFIGMFDAPNCFKPLDWNKLRISAVNELAGIIESYCVDVVSAASITDAILAAGYRKCHNKAPSDKE